MLAPGSYTIIHMLLKSKRITLLVNVRKPGRERATHYIRVFILSDEAATADEFRDAVVEDVFETKLGWRIVQRRGPASMVSVLQQRTCLEHSHG